MYNYRLNCCKDILRTIEADALDPVTIVSGTGELSRPHRLQVRPQQRDKTINVFGLRLDNSSHGSYATFAPCDADELGFIELAWTWRMLIGDDLADGGCFYQRRRCWLYKVDSCRKDKGDKNGNRCSPDSKANFPVGLRIPLTKGLLS